MISVVFLAVTVIVYRAEVYDEMSIIGTFDYELDWSFYTSTLLSILMQLKQENFHSGRGVRIYPPGYLIPQIPYPIQGVWDQIYLPSGKDMGVEIPYPRKGPGTRDQGYPTIPVDRPTLEKTLPSRNFVGGR